MSPLHIVTNQSADSRPSPQEERFQHLGTRDRSTPGLFYDFPGKTQALLNAAYELRDTSTHFGHPLSLSPIVIKGSERVPSREQLLAAHTEDYLTRFESAARTARDRAERGEDQFVDFGEDADVTAGTYRAALSSVGAAFDAVDIALQSRESTAFALVWPPGHHAEPERAMGYCYLATAALATLYARDHAVQVRPGERNRVVLIDIDHHQGNGSAAVLANERDVLFVDQYYRSPYNEERQRYTDGEFDAASGEFRGSGREYPYTRHDASIGCTPHNLISGPNIVNVEFQGEQDSHTVIDTFVTTALPAIRKFSPDVVIWSVGLDSVAGDPIGGLGLAPESFYTLIKGVRLALPHARHCGILEGGYHLHLAPKALKPALLALHETPDAHGVEWFLPYRNAFHENAR